MRDVRGGTSSSTHSWGAAIDLGFHAPAYPSIRDELIVWLVAYSEEWHLSAIHDYRGSRIWRAGRTKLENEACTLWWKAQKRDQHGMGQPWGNWLHIETTRAGWADTRTAAQRGIG